MNQFLKITLSLSVSHKHAHTYTHIPTRVCVCVCVCVCVYSISLENPDYYQGADLYTNLDKKRSLVTSKASVRLVPMVQVHRGQ